MIERILIALDGSPESERIFAEVDRVAGPDTKFDLLHVVEPSPREVPEVGIMVADVARSYLERIARRLPGRDVRIHIRSGEPESEIPKAAQNLGPDLIALTTHARKGLSRLFMGSVAETIVRRTSRPVLLTRPNLSRPRRPLQRILVPIDGTPESKQVFNTVRQLARNAPIEIILLQVVVNLIVVDPLTGTGPISALDLVPDPTPSLHALAARLEREGLQARAMVVFGGAADQIIEQARLLDVDLIAMASSARKGLARAFRSSISFKVLRHADRAVLLHRVDPPAESGLEVNALHVQEGEG
jgi:nucleotide-binding universal stress UspA family protein